MGTGDDSEGEGLSALLDTALRVTRAATLPVADRLAALRERADDGRFQLAIVGQFKRGKSTLINALLGAPILPVGVIPLTAVPTFISWRADAGVRVTYASDGRTDTFTADTPEALRAILFRFVSEESNPRNRLDVGRVDLFYPASLLRHHVVLIDTPGIGSTHRHNTDAALKALPECDAAIFVTSADPPLTEAELAYLQDVNRQSVRTYYVLNKADYLSPDDLRTSVQFLAGVLLQAGIEANDAIFPVSAALALRGKQDDNAEDLARSRIGPLETSLADAFETEKSVLLQSALRQKTMDCLAEADADVRFRVRALEIPIEDLQRRAIVLGQALDHIAEEGRVAHDLLQADHRRLLAELEENARLMREEGREHLLQVLSDALSVSDDPREAARKALVTAVPKHFDQTLQRSVDTFGARTKEVMRHRTRHVDALVNDVRRTIADVFDIPFVATPESETFHLRQEPFWVAQPWREGLIPDSFGVLDRLLPRSLRRARQIGLISDRVADLARRNTENLRWSLLQSINDTFRNLATALDARLSNSIASTRDAINAALALRTSKTESVADDLAHMNDALAQIDVLRSRLSRGDQTATTERGEIHAGGPTWALGWPESARSPLPAAPSSSSLAR